MGSSIYIYINTMSNLINVQTKFRLQGLPLLFILMLTCPDSCFPLFVVSSIKSLSSAGDQTHKMSTERCVCLIMAGLANRVKEMWIGQQPFLLFFYAWQYTPTLAWYATGVLGRKRVQNFKAGLVRTHNILMSSNRLVTHRTERWQLVPGALEIACIFVKSP